MTRGNQEKRVHWSHSAPELLGGKERNATEPPRTSDFRPATSVLTVPSLHLSSSAAMPKLSSATSGVRLLAVQMTLNFFEFTAKLWNLDADQYITFFHHPENSSTIKLNKSTISRPSLR
ncbi:hypothetical protein K438DRAFT_1804611 [Mycena galopus ATCC 62051]|nr:hypothetical protein K438DRAFT_1804611 [Mycena galopus ATCC 62051]